MAATSRIPAALDGLLAAAVAAVGSTVAVVDGPPLSWTPLRAPTDVVSDRQALFVGATPNGEASAESGQDFNAAGNVSRDERAVLHCTAWAGAGDQDIKARRDEAFAIVGALESAITANPNLGVPSVLYYGPLAFRRVSSRQTEAGPDCVVEFDVPVRSYLS